MNFYEAQEFFKKLYPDRLVTFDFDDKCIRHIECIYTDGQLHPTNHVEYQQVKVTPQGMPSQYVPIQPHRMILTANTIKNKLANDDIYMHPDWIQSLNELKGTPYYDIAIKEHIEMTGLSRAQIESKIWTYRIKIDLQKSNQ